MHVKTKSKSCYNCASTAHHGHECGRARPRGCFPIVTAPIRAPNRRQTAPPTVKHCVEEFHAYLDISSGGAQRQRRHSSVSHEELRFLDRLVCRKDQRTGGGHYRNRRGNSTSPRRYGFGHQSAAGKITKRNWPNERQHQGWTHRGAKLAPPPAFPRTPAKFSQADWQATLSSPVGNARSKHQSVLHNTSPAPKKKSPLPVVKHAQKAPATPPPPPPPPRKNLLAAPNFQRHNGEHLGGGRGFAGAFGWRQPPNTVPKRRNNNHVQRPIKFRRHYAPVLDASSYPDIIEL